VLNFISRWITFRLGYQPLVMRKVLLVDVKLHCDLQGYMGESAGCAYAAAVSAFFRSRINMAGPSITGIVTSHKMTSGCQSTAAARVSLPDPTSRRKAWIEAKRYLNNFANVRLVINMNVPKRSHDGSHPAKLRMLSDVY
jgi:hypothetical protein